MGDNVLIYPVFMKWRRFAPIYTFSNIVYYKSDKQTVP